MDDFGREALRRLPLAEAALRVWAWITNESFLDAVFQRHRGRSFEKLLTFPVMVYLIANALLHCRGSGRRSFEKGRADGTLPTSIVAAFGKLRRLPISLSMGFLADCTVRLMELFPQDITAVSLPASLAGMEPIVLDGKAIKNVAKRLKPLRGVGGGIVGGRALVALRLRMGVVVAMHVHPDGDVNDVRFVPDLVPQVRGLVPGPRLFVGDRQFCNMQHLPVYVAAGDHFLIRYHNNVTFTRDTTRPVRTGVDKEGRKYEEEWGWLGRTGHKQRRYVRRITLHRPQAEPISVVTDLEDADQFPALDLLDLYLCRWGIERVFQQVTEVFGLEGLIGSSPEATLFQFAFCLVLYNILQVVRAYVAQGSHHSVPEVSTEKLFLDVQNQLIAWNELMLPTVTAKLIKPLTLEQTRARLKKLLGETWKDVWKKAPPQKRRPPEHSSYRSHKSAYRLLEEARAAPKPARSSRRQ
jgi:Transposase DDE domain